MSKRTRARARAQTKVRPSDEDLQHLKVWMEADRQEKEAYAAWVKAHPEEKAAMELHLWETDEQLREWVQTAVELQIKAMGRMLQEWRRRQQSGE